MSFQNIIFLTPNASLRGSGSNLWILWRRFLEREEPTLYAQRHVWQVTYGLAQGVRHSLEDKRLS